MKRLTQALLTCLLVNAAAPCAKAFSYLGPFKVTANGYSQDWQVGAIGYNLPGDIGGPMEAMEGYRWTAPIVTYAYDRAFLSYFGTNGVNAVEEAIAILNALPPASQITNDGGRLFIRGQPVPFDTKRVNYRAEALGIIDVKSWALRNLVEEMGLAQPERWCFGIRGRMVIAGIPFYSVVKMNYDPITLQPTNRVNGATYSYIGLEPLAPGNYADTLEFAVDPFAANFSSVAGLGTVDVLFPPALQGVYFDALSHDDVGGLRWLLSPNNIAVDVLLPGSQASSGISTGGGGGSLTGGSPWAPAVNLTNSAGSGVWNPVLILTNVPGVTNVPPGTTITNDLSTVPLVRPGVDKIQFQRVAFDSLLGNTFTPITVRWTDRFFSNGRFVSQNVTRTVTQPDIVFRAGDPGVAAFVPALSDRTSTAGWTNMAAFNGRQDALGGPGVIVPPIEILFTDLLPYFVTINGEIEPSPDTLLGPLNFIWGSFDGSTNPPIVYPQRLNLTPEELAAYIATFTRTP